MVINITMVTSIVLDLCVDTDRNKFTIMMSCPD